jgi:2-oxoisovalerate dehydrogenase E1 component
MKVEINKILEKALQVRYFEERILEEYKKGQIHGTVHTCIGQEIFPCLLSEYTSDYYWFSNHRGHGHYIAKTNDFLGLASEILLKEGAVANGVGGSQHLKNKNFISNGIQGGQTGIAVGYSSKILNNSTYKSVMFLGDGTLGAGHVYEALNLASLHNSKIIFVLEDNKVAQSTPSSKTYGGDIEQIIKGYGINYYKCDSQNIDSMIQAIELAVKSNIIQPVFIHLNTERLSAHSKSDDNREDQYIDNLKLNDLLNIKLSDGTLSYESKYIDNIKDIFKEVLSSDENKYKTSVEERNKIKISDLSNNLKFSEHINECFNSFLSENNDSVMVGEDIEDDPYKSGKIYGGAFKVTKGLSTIFPEQVFSMPISESGFTGFATGLALRGNLTIVEIMFADFLSQNFDQIFHQISKIPSIYGSRVDLPILIRTAGFAGNGYGPTHSSSMENIFFGLPNLDIFVPNLYFNYSNILEYLKSSKKPILVIEPKINYNKKMSPSIYAEYEINNDNFITTVEPKKRKPQVTVFAYGPEFDLILSNLEYIAKEYEIYVNVFSPVNLNNLEVEPLLSLLNNSNNNLINLNQSLNNSHVGNHWLSELTKYQKLNNYKSNNIIDWIPTGKSENEVLLNIEAIVRMIKNINE